MIAQLLYCQRLTNARIRSSSLAPYARRTRRKQQRWKRKFAVRVFRPRAASEPRRRPNRLGRASAAPWPQAHSGRSRSVAPARVVAMRAYFFVLGYGALLPYPQRNGEAEIGAVRRARRHPQVPAVSFDD
jgi:hypothetical protein